MTLNREVFAEDPTQHEIPNLGVTKVQDPSSEDEWAVLRYELTHFVCDGEYERGLERILNSYSGNVGKPEQPAAWVSGFYGSGKSHLVRVLQQLWTDVEFPDGATARGLVDLPPAISGALDELKTIGKRNGGLWAAAGTLNAGAGDSVRLAFLGIILGAAGLPKKYEPATFVLWLRKEDLLDEVRTAVEIAGRDWLDELKSLYVSPVISEALVKASPSFAKDAAEAKQLLKAQFPPVKDISLEDMLTAMDGVLAMKSSKAGRAPCTLIVLDELQQYVNEDPDKMLDVQNVVEACSSRFESQLLFVATGQSALQATPTLAKLQGRFTVRVNLSDTDVESVVRTVVLRKSPDKVKEVRDTLEHVSGEIDRQLKGSKIGPQPSDHDDLVPDYPILPVRRRFWEKALRAIDVGGGAGQLRTQLRMVHEATKLVADKPLGTVVPADFLYDQQATGMLETGALLRETFNQIEELRDRADHNLRSRLCALVYLISKLPTESGADIGVRATSESLADLLVEDLNSGSDGLRKSVKESLVRLADEGILNEVGSGEYRLLTKESTAWQQDYLQRLPGIKNDAGRIASDRDQELRKSANQELAGLSLTQGHSKTARRMLLHFGPTPPLANQADIPVWIRDGWDTSEKSVRDEAITAGTDSPIIFVWLPKQDSEALSTALAERAASNDTLSARPTPATQEGLEAQAGMRARTSSAAARVSELISHAVRGAKVFQGGGNDITEATLRDSVLAAGTNAMARLFPQFADGDSSVWDKVQKRAREGSGDPLEPLGHKGEIVEHPVCKEILSFVTGGGTKGSEVRKHFTGPPYGWPQDAVDGALLALLSANAISARQNGIDIGLKDVSAGKVSTTAFYREAPIPKASERIEVRQLLAKAGLPADPGEEAAVLKHFIEKLIRLSHAATGEPPLPALGSLSDLQQFAQMHGNALVSSAYNKREELADQFAQLSKQAELAQERQPQWDTLLQAVRAGVGLAALEHVREQVNAVRESRSLLSTPDPVPPLLEQTSTCLREALQKAQSKVAAAYASGLADLQSFAEWTALPEGRAEGVLSAVGLGEPVALDIGTTERLLQALEKAPLADWPDKASAIPEKVKQAWHAAAQELKPKAVAYSPPHATLESAQQVDAYVESLREELKGKIKDGPVMI